MNSSINFNCDQTNAITDPGYRIQKIENCRIVTGHVPLSDMEMLIQGFSDQAVMATDIASRIGATFVIGEPEDIERLRLCDLPISDQRLRDAEQARKAGLPETVIQWLLTGERGLSSDALCKAYFGLPERAGTDHPLDPGDLRRCLLFLQAVDEPNQWRFDQLQDLSQAWLLLSCHWTELVACFEQECAQSTNNTAPETYALIQKIIKGECS
ncbi:hypothetical protein [Methylobacter sp. YRD-M1]|uniref:hypothetical protein n=1 Tax=Methylobacter sp. YRD-M1 TaxID=2911520 RepID=UPI00227C81BE|nr:hypothetical protein [Methylobacter sp. YRD-M1]WAK04334.1 hypothetical protein LZ558_21950 [Methylobacter sp. YRD-M1]